MSDNKTNKSNNSDNQNALSKGSKPKYVFSNGNKYEVYPNGKVVFISGPNAPKDKYGIPVVPKTVVYDPDDIIIKKPKSTKTQNFDKIKNFDKLTLDEQLKHLNYLLSKQKKFKYIAAAFEPIIKRIKENNYLKNHNINYQVGDSFVFEKDGIPYRYKITGLIFDWQSDRIYVTAVTFDEKGNEEVVKFRIQTVKQISNQSKKTAAIWKKNVKNNNVVEYTKTQPVNSNPTFFEMLNNDDENDD